MIFLLVVLYVKEYIRPSDQREGCSLLIQALTHLIPPGFPTTTRNVSLPVDAGALDAQQDAEVDGGPARVGLAAVAALLVARQTLDPLQDGLPSDAALPRLAGRVDAAGGRRSRSVQMLNMNDTQQSHSLGFYVLFCTAYVS